MEPPPITTTGDFSKKCSISAGEGQEGEEEWYEAERGADSGEEGKTDEGGIEVKGEEGVGGEGGGEEGEEGEEGGVGKEEAKWSSPKWDFNSSRTEGVREEECSGAGKVLVSTSST